MAARSKSKAGGKPKVPCTNPGICGNTKNHMVGTFTQKRCDEITKRRAAGEVITAENVMSVRPPGMEASSDFGARSDEVSEKMKSLKQSAEAWRDSPQDALNFVRWAKNFTDYSAFNRLMIRLQNPEATAVGSAKKWVGLGREVAEDEKPIEIFAPGMGGERAKKDKDGNVERDADGKQVMERRFVNRFRAVSVYDIAQTTGDTPPEIETPVANPELLERVVVGLESDYFIAPMEVVAGADSPARMLEDGSMAYNASTADESQRLVNRLVAVGMSASARLRKDTEARIKDPARHWGEAEHMYAGISAAWSLGQDAGIDLTDLAVQKMADYKGKEQIASLAAHGSKVTEHIENVRNGLPAEIADALAS